jgi:hypothetical protein
MGASMIRMKQKIERETESGAKERPGAVPRPPCLGEGTEGQGELPQAVFS